MPNARELAEAIGLAAAVAGVILLVGGRLLGRGNPRRASVAWALGVGAGFFCGSWLLGLRPHWPFLEDKDRFLGILLPLAVAVEHLTRDPLIFLCPRGTGCDECDEAHASIPPRNP